MSDTSQVAGIEGVGVEREGLLNLWRCKTGLRNLGGTGRCSEAQAVQVLVLHRSLLTAVHAQGSTEPYLV